MEGLVIISKTTAIISLIVALLAPVTYPFFNTFLAAIMAMAACVLGVAALISGTQGAYRVTAIVGIILGVLEIAMWLVVMFLAISARTGSPL